MSITPNGLAVTFRRAAKARKMVKSVTETTDHPHDDSGVVFHVEDKQGGILRVTIVQYKEPVR